MHIEKWKDVEGYEDLYQISNSGKVKRLSYPIYDKFYGWRIVPEKILTGATKEGYKQIVLFKEGEKQFFLVHRLVAFAFIPNPENKAFVNHKDSIKDNNAEDNLEWSTAKENSIHGHNSGTFQMPRGSSCGSTSLSDLDVTYIKTNPDRLTQIQLAKMYKISQGGVSKIINGKNWKFHDAA